VARRSYNAGVRALAYGSLLGTWFAESANVLPGDGAWRYQHDLMGACPVVALKSGRRNL